MPGREGWAEHRGIGISCEVRGDGRVRQGLLAGRAGFVRHRTWKISGVPETVRVLRPDELTWTEHVHDAGLALMTARLCTRDRVAG